jgi:hypothetical protein
LKIKKLIIQDVLEFDTDECGHVTTRDDLIQIKLWNNFGEIKILMGTINFYFRNHDFSYSGILNKKNSDDLFNTWNYTDVSNFILRKYDTDFYCDIDYCFYHDDFPEQYRDYRYFIRQFPEHDYMKINI